jgi:glucose/arabinose dehydrogenase
MRRALLLALIPALALAAPIWAQNPQFRAETLAEGLEHPWGLAFLPDGRMLVTERSGALNLVTMDGKVSKIGGTPEVAARGQGGLLDIALDPKFSENRLVYLSYAEAGEGGAGTAVARGRLSEDATTFENPEVIFRQAPKVEGKNHFGSRLVFAPDGTLFVTLGERFDYREKAQDLGTTLGKVVRINPDGSIPKDNPFVGQEGALPQIWSYGHRNPAKRRDQSGDRQALDRRARRARRRRDQRARTRQELWLAGHLLRREL